MRSEAFDCDIDSGRGTLSAQSGRATAFQQLSASSQLAQLVKTGEGGRKREDRLPTKHRWFPTADVFLDQGCLCGRTGRLA